MVLEKTLESHLDNKQIKPVSPKEVNPEYSLEDQFSSVQSLSCVRLFANPWIAARQASLSVTISWSLLKLMYIESVMPSNHLMFCPPLLPLPSIFPSVGVFSRVDSSHQVAKGLEL